MSLFIQFGDVLDICVFLRSSNKEMHQLSLSGLEPLGSFCSKTPKPPVMFEEQQILENA